MSLKKCAIIAVSIMALALTLLNAYAQTNDTNKERSFMNCYDGTMKFFVVQIMFSPPEIKFNITDLTSPEVKQYISDSCNFYHNKSGIWLSGTDDELDKKSVQIWSRIYAEGKRT